MIIFPLNSSTSPSPPPAYEYLSTFPRLTDRCCDVVDRSGMDVTVSGNSALAAQVETSLLPDLMSLCLFSKISALVSVFGSLISISSFYTCPEWRKRLFTLDSIYFFLSYGPFPSPLLSDHLQCLKFVGITEFQLSANGEK
jgi:hypothetical protein